MFISMTDLHFLQKLHLLNTLRPSQNGCRFADGIFKCIFLNENVWISLNISLKYNPKVPFNNIPTLVPIMAWRRPGDKPLSEPMMVNLLPHTCVTRSQWVKGLITVGKELWATATTPLWFVVRCRDVPRAVLSGAGTSQERSPIKSYPLAAFLFPAQHRLGLL